MRCAAHDVPCGSYHQVFDLFDLGGGPKPDLEHSCLPLAGTRGAKLTLMHRWGGPRGERFTRVDPFKGILVSVTEREFNATVKEVRSGITVEQKAERTKLLGKLRRLLKAHTAPQGPMKVVWYKSQMAEAVEYDLWALRRMVAYWEGRKPAPKKEQ